MNNVFKIIATSAIAIVGLTGVAFADDLNVVPQSPAANEAYADQVLTVAAAFSDAAIPTTSVISVYPTNAAESGVYADQVLTTAAAFSDATTPNASAVSDYPANATESGVYADHVLAQAAGQRQGIAHNVASAPSQVN